MDDAIAINATTQPGKKVDATSFVRGPDTVYRERVVFGDDAGEIIAAFLDDQPAGDELAVPVRQVGIPGAVGALTFGNVNVTATAAQLPAHACSRLRLKAPTGNSGNIWVDTNSSVGVDVGWILYPGEELELPITNSNLLFCVSDGGTQKLQLLAL